MAEAACLVDSASVGSDLAALSPLRMAGEATVAWTYSLSGRHEPGWLARVVNQLKALQLLQFNWDSYGGVPVRGEVLRSAANLLCEMAGKRTPVPSVVPTSDGSVQVEWHTRGIDLEVKWITPMRVHVCLQDMRHQLPPVDEDIFYNYLPLRAAIRELTSRT